MATLYLADGRIETVKPRKGKIFSLTELQTYVGGYIQIAATIKGRLLIVNEEGRLKGLKPNLNATNLAEQLIVGDAILINDDEMEYSKYDLRVKNKRYAISSIVWAVCGFSVKNYNIEDFETHRLEVIGNIHDNPELLNTKI